MADSELIARQLAGDAALAGTTLSALVPNQHGLEQALEAGMKDISVFTAASEAFAERNIGMTVEKSLERFADVIASAKAAGLGVRGYVSAYDARTGALATTEARQRDAIALGNGREPRPRGRVGTEARVEK